MEQVRAETVRAANAVAGPGEAYGPVRNDRVAWYLLMARTASEAPTNLDVLQAARVLPFISAIGRNVEHLELVSRVEERVKKWLSVGERGNPDSILFELLVAACYRRHGWDTEFIPESKAQKQPDLRAGRGAEERLVECKRLAMRSEASRQESLHWARMWRLFADALVAAQHEFIFDIKFHKPMDGYPDGYLSDRIVPKLSVVAADGSMIDDEDLTVGIVALDRARIRRELRENYAKCGSPREIQLLTGRAEPRAPRFSAMIAGRRGLINDESMGPALYWDDIDYAVGAFWTCDAPEAVERKARDVRKHLADAAGQLAGSTPSSIHVGLETIDGELVEEERLTRIMKTVTDFDASGTALDRIYCHMFGPEAPPDKIWDFAETTCWHRTRPRNPEPLEGRLLIVPDENMRDGVHWKSKLDQT